MSNHASKALAEASLLGEPQIYNTISKRNRVPLTTFYYRDHRQPSIKTKTEGQLYLTLSKEKTLEKYLKLITNLGNLMRIKYLFALVFSIAG
jgi:hypothetical protein